MASHDPDPNLPPLSGRAVPGSAAPKKRAGSEPSLLREALAPVASLKLTIGLFAVSLFLVLAGTLAQARMDIWKVVHQYFRTWIATIDINVFFPPAWFPSMAEADLGSFWFPGGFLIGAVMLVNLLAAHGLRFKIQSSGVRLSVGLFIIALGAAITAVVISGDLNRYSVETNSLFESRLLWELTKGALAAACILGGIGLAYFEKDERSERWLLLTTLFSLGAVIAGLYAHDLMVWRNGQGDEFLLSMSSLRILWQLMQGAVAGLVLLLGCIMAFRKRAGIVLLHSGIILLMFNELLVGKSAEEGQMQIAEGETVNYVDDIREVELAFVDRSGQKEDKIVAIPQAMLEGGSDTISDERLPVDVRVKEFLQNSKLRRLETDEQSPATTGVGLTWIAEAASAATGTDMGGGVDDSAAYIELIPKDNSDSAETHLLSLVIARQEIPETIAVDGKTWDVYLRFKRTYKPYSMHLVDVRFDKYIGTNTPQNYSSELQLYDEATQSTRMVKTWMNNPVRTEDETFYQSNYYADPETGKEMTGIQVVKNSGWMIPYVSCMIVGVGMIAQFGIVLLRFLGRRASQGTAVIKQAVSKRQSTLEQTAPSNPFAIWLPILTVCGLVLLVAWQAVPPKVPSDEMNLAEFGKLPVVYQGRIKPFDTLARNTLRIISGKETYAAPMSRQELEEEWQGISKAILRKWDTVTPEQLDAVDYDSEKLVDLIEEATADERQEIQDTVHKLTTQTQPAIRWLLDVVAAQPDVAEHRVFRIENFELQEVLGLERRSGFRYALKEFQPKVGEFEQQAKEARKLDKAKLSTYQRKLLALDQRFHLFTLLAASFNPPAVPPIPTQDEFENDREGAQQKMMQLMQVLVEGPKRLAAMQPPLAIPAEKGDEAADGAADGDWQPYSTAWTKAFAQANILGQEADPTTLAFANIIAAYRDGKADEFDDAVRDYRYQIEKIAPDKLDMEKVAFESFFNRFGPFFLCSVLYLVAFLLTIFSWLAWQRPLGNTAFWMIVALFVLHTLALGARIYISGRPPVTNLYSSAVFIGWAAVLFGIVIEAMFRIGIGNAVASVAGFMTLLIAHFLSLDGDTFVVLQAVLDTQFWLATHVVCITLGYAATFVAGTLAIYYIIGGLLTPALCTKVEGSQQTVGKILAGMIYGVLCFAIFFSFIGTVLGGLWADDSWGRFWGWDPKENGALIIVIWNAIVLHARWDKLVKDRGLAVLAVAGNICTCWSWFGVNELGVGLHSYGFTEGVLLSLGIAVGVYSAIIIAGCLPLTLWASFRPHPPKFDKVPQPPKVANV